MIPTEQRKGKDEGERVVGYLVDAIVRDVADGDAAGLGGGEVDVVNADRVADDRPRPPQGRYPPRGR